MVRQKILILTALAVSFNALAGSRFAEQVLSPSVRIYNDSLGGALELVLQEKNVEAIYDVGITRFRDIHTGFNAVPVEGTVDYQIKLSASDHFCKREERDEEFELPGVQLHMDGKPLLVGQTNGNSYQAERSQWHELVIGFPTLERSATYPFLCYGYIVITAELGSDSI